MHPRHFWIERRLQQIIREVRAAWDAPIVELAVMPGRVCLLVAVDLQNGIRRLVRQIRAVVHECSGTSCLAAESLSGLVGELLLRRRGWRRQLGGC
jgi:REP element-mobilizing transposase RayT